MSNELLFAQLGRIYILPLGGGNVGRREQQADTTCDMNPFSLLGFRCIFYRPGLPCVYSIGKEIVTLGTVMDLGSHSL